MNMIRRDLTGTLAQWLADHPEVRLGELLIRPNSPAGSFTLCHWQDAARTDLVPHTEPADARQLALLDDAEAYRPLRTAPNLRHGWRLEVQSVTALREALDGFYPAMLGLLHDFRAGNVQPIPLRETLGRQTGMYALTKKLTDPQAQTLVGQFCRSDVGCLKTILWPLAPGQPITTLPPEKFTPPADLSAPWPLLCHEACNLLVADARTVIKAARVKAPAPVE